MKKVVLDTNAYAALTQGQYEIKETLENADQIFVPVFVVAELAFGFKNGNREQSNVLLFQNFLQLSGVSIQHTTNETAEIYADLYLDLKRQGTPIPTHDIWIAAMAIETGSVLLTYDKHFLKVAKVRVWGALK